MKLHKSLLLFGASALILGGCADKGPETEGSVAEKPETEEVGTESTEEFTEDIEEKTEDINYESTPVVTIEELPYTIEIENPTPDSAGSVYGIASFTNESEYPIVGFTLVATLLDTNENTYYSTYDTVMPGNQSPNFDSFAPSTGELSDLEVKVVEYTIRLDDGSEQMIEYDTQLESYEVFYYGSE